jgi:hypothetical protein
MAEGGRRKAIVDPRSKIQDSRFKIQDSRLKIRDSRLYMRWTQANDAPPRNASCVPPVPPVPPVRTSIC